MLMPLISYVLDFKVFIPKCENVTGGTKHVDVSSFCAFVVVAAWNLDSISLIQESCLL